MTIPRLGLRAGAAMALVTLLAGCPDRQSPDRAALEIRGTDPRAGASGPAVSPEGVVFYDGYQAARAREGETVGDLAGRLGLSATELGAYNGLAATHRLRAGDELVLPPRPGGYAELAPAAPAAPAPEPLPPAAPEIEAVPLDAGPAPELAEEEALAAAPAESPLPNASGWSPELALEAIERADPAAPEAAPPEAAAEPGTEPPGSRTALALPPSADDPLPANPAPVPELASPGLSQYQRSRPAPDPGAAPARSRLARPVDGPVALGFLEGSGGVRNEGVDFDAPAGAPVFAAEDGTVVLVSESLGALGTIVLIRHDDDLLTSYGRISGVTVGKGERVVRGQQIGTVAEPDGGGPPRMHFEVRRGGSALDPMEFI